MQYVYENNFKIFGRVMDHCSCSHA